MDGDAFIAGLVQKHILRKPCRQVFTAPHGDRPGQGDGPVRAPRPIARGTRNLVVSDYQQQEQQSDQPYRLHTSPFHSRLAKSSLVTPSPHCRGRLVAINAAGSSHHPGHGPARPPMDMSASEAPIGEVIIPLANCSFCTSAHIRRTASPLLSKAAAFLSFPPLIPNPWLNAATEVPESPSRAARGGCRAPIRRRRGAERPY